MSEALTRLGIVVEWLGRKPRADDAVNENLTQPTAFYYQLSERLRLWLPEKIVLAVKAIEHIWQSIRLVRFLSRGKFSLAHFQWTPMPMFDQFIFKRIQSRMPIVLTVHDTEVFHGNASHPLQRKGWRHVLSAADQVIVHVDAASKELEVHGVQKDRINLVPHPAFSAPDIEAKRKAMNKFPRTSLGFSDHRVNMLLFGRLAPYKGLEIILSAVQRMTPDERSNIRIVLAGKPAIDVTGYMERIQQSQIDDCLVVNPKFLSDDELIAYLSSADVLLFPYLDIDASGALMQALPYSPAIIASKIGIFEELLIHEQNAILIPPNDEKSLSLAILRLASEADVRHRISKNIAAVVKEDLSWDRAAELTRHVYNRAMEPWR